VFSADQNDVHHATVAFMKMCVAKENKNTNFECIFKLQYSIALGVLIPAI